MKNLGVVVAGVIGLVVALWFLKHIFWFIGLAVNLVWLAILIAVCIFVVGLVRRAMRV
jgi:hypothetical protein